MTSFANKSVRWIVRLLAAHPSDATEHDPGIAAVLDGATATAAAEATWCETAGFGATAPSAVACRAWRQMHTHAQRNAFGRAVDCMEAGTPQGALAAAIGAASAGLRSTAFLSGQDLAGSLALLHHASGRRVPLVIHAATKGMSSHSLNLGGGHESWFSASDTGWGQFFATTAQEALDLALAARLASERALLPIMIGIDGLETGMGAQDVLLPDPPLVRELLGETNSREKPPTPAQRILLGEHRTRTPRWHDPDHPMLTGAVQPLARGMASAAATEPFFTDHASPIIADALALVAHRTGRDLSPVLSHRVDSAEIVLIACGAILETAIRVAEELRARERIRVGIIGVRQFRPWPEKEILDAIGESKVAVVLERSLAPLAADGPLTREIRGTLARGGAQTRVCTATHGVGGACATGEDIAELCREMVREPRARVLVGIEHLPAESAAPKQQAVFDAVRRDYPDLASRTVSAKRQTISSVPKGAHTACVIRRSGSGDEPLSTGVAGLLHALLPVSLRSLPDIMPPGLLPVCFDRIMAGAGSCTPDHDSLSDIALLAPTRVPHGTRPTSAVRPGGALLIPCPVDSEEDIRLQAADLLDARTRNIRLIVVPFEPPKAYEQPEPVWRRHEALLGALVGVLNSTRSEKTLSPAKAADMRASQLEREESANAHERLEAFRSGIERWNEVEPDAVPAWEPAEPASQTPELLTRIHSSSQPISDLPGFWSRAVAGGTDDVPPSDPFSAMPTVPALSAALRTVSDPTDNLVEFDPSTCDGAGEAWTSCPDGSIAAVSVNAEGILETGIRMATESGKSADALRPILTKLGAQINKRALAADRPPTNIREASEDAYAWIIERMSPPEDRRRSLDEAFRAVMDSVGMLPIARTLPFFDEAMADSPDSGEFLIIGTNPDACVDVHAAVGQCEGRGLRIVERTPSKLERARMLWRIFERLPDTAGKTIERAASHELVGPLAAIMLAKTCSQAMAPGDAAEIGSGERLALRFIFAACEAEMQPRIQRLLGEISDLRKRLFQKIHEMLAEALPDANLDALADGLHALGREDVDLASLSASVSDAVTGQKVDAVRLGRIVDAARALADLEWRLERGASGLGRARAGVAIAAGSATLWAVAAPLNPFQGPVTVDATGWTPELARGLCEGHMGTAVEAARILRWVKAELDRPGEAAQEPDRLRSLSWNDLTELERATCPPLLLIGDDESLATGALGSLIGLLASPIPVKVVLLTGAGGRADSAWGADTLGSYPAGTANDCGLLAVLTRNAYVAGCSIAAGDHLVKSMRHAMTFQGPALLHVYAPSPQRHGFPPHWLMDHAKLALRSRAHCLFRFNPSSGGVFGSCLDLTGNPDPLDTFAGVEDGTPVTPLEWAVSQARFRDEFRIIASGEQGTGSGHFLSLSLEERRNKLAKVTNPLDHSEWIASDRIVALADDRLRLWRTLQELAGLVTPFTRRVREDAERAVAAEHEAKMTALCRQHEQELASSRASFEGIAVERVRDGLMRLAGYRSPEQHTQEETNE